MVEFFVEGIPVPQGSKVCKCINGKSIMWEANSKLKAWRDTVTAQAQIEMIAKGLETITEPVALLLEFKLPKPKSVTRPYPSVKPDLDKLIRAICDGLTKSGIYQDDALVITIAANKTYSENPGCLIKISEV